MNIQLIVDNLLQPAILFFALGMLAVLVKSDLEIPKTLSKLFSLYLLLSIGFKGGVKLSESGLSMDAAKAVLAGLAMSSIVPLYAFAICRRFVSIPNAAAVAATYGSISAVTFLTAMTFLIRLNIPYGGYMVAVMALMESPAIIIGIMLARKHLAGEMQDIRKRELVKESLTNSSVFLLLGSMVIGMLSGSRGWQAMEPFAGNLFQGMLCFFLLDIGMMSARQLGDVKKAGPAMISVALLLPIFNGMLGLVIARSLNMGMGDAVLFCILTGSASYIAVPAAFRHALPEANPGMYVSMALAVTFPFNIAIGIPMYSWLVQVLW